LRANFRLKLSNTLYTRLHIGISGITKSCQEGNNDEVEINLEEFTKVSVSGTVAFCLIHLY